MSDPGSPYSDVEKASGYTGASYAEKKSRLKSSTDFALLSGHEANALENLGNNDNVPRAKFAKLWAIVEFLHKYGVEARGIERVPSDQRTQICICHAYLTSVL